jgi:hypothetical protein
MTVQKRTRIIKWFLFGVLFFLASLYARTITVDKQPYAWTETCNWIGATEGLWNVTTNWDCNGTNRVPTTTDKVVIDATLTVNLSAQTTVEEVVLGNDLGTTSPQLNFSYDAITNGALIVSGGNMTINPGATVTHTQGSTVVVGTVYIIVSAGDLTVDGSIDTLGKGYNPQQGPGKGLGASLVASGAGHGGIGGGGGSDGRVAGGVYYGSLSEPTTIGSGGGIDGTGSRGGGAVRLTVSGTTAVNGTISVQGGLNPGTSSSDAGGGSGGSIYVTTNFLTGNGILDASGTNAYRLGGAGAGAGGRIAVYYTTDNSSLSIRSYGGTIGGSGGQVAAAGTIYKKQVGSDAVVIYDNAGRDPLTIRSAPLDVGQLYQSVTITGRARVNADSSTVTIGVLEVINNGLLQFDPGSNTVYSQLIWNTGANLVDRGGDFLLASGGGDLTVNADTSFFADYPRTFTNVTVNGVLTHTENTTAETYKTILTVSGDFTVPSTGAVNLDGKGYTAGYGPGKGISGNGASGAGYGGEGGICVNLGTAGGGAYGSLSDPVNIGSGGGLDEGGPLNGGGAIKLTVSGTTTINGTFSANGKVTTASGTNDAGGGSGGSINIITNVLAGNSIVRANGSNGYRYGGAGGGGRIAVVYTTDNSTLTYEAFGGMYGDNAAAGTIYKKHGSNDPVVIIDNDGTDPGIHRAGTIPAASLIGELNVQNFGSIELTTTSTANAINITNNGILENASTANTSYTSFTWNTGATLIDRGGTLSIVSGGGNLVVPLDTTLVADVARTYSSVLITGSLTHTNNATAETYKIYHTTTGDYTVNGTVNLDSKGYMAVRSWERGKRKRCRWWWSRWRRWKRDKCPWRCYLWVVKATSNHR